MRQVQEIESALLELAPYYMKEDWDNVGLLCGRGSQEVQRILVALDPFCSVAEEAAEVEAQLLVTHHPLIFHPARAVNDRDPVGRTILFLVEHGISAVNLHTNLDSVPGGVNDVLAGCLGLQNVGVLAPAGKDEQGREYGIGRWGVIDEMELTDFLAFVRERLRCGGLRYADGGRPVRRVAVGGGACGDLLRLALDLGCDTFVTADLKYNQFADARDLGLNLIDAGHFPTENPVCSLLTEYLRGRFPELDVIVSKNHCDVVNFF